MAKDTNKANKFTQSMFDDIKDAFKRSNTGGGGSFKNILKMQAVNSYHVRLLPNLENSDDTFYHYYDHGWKSKSTGQYVSAMCPTTWGKERCPICEQRFKLYNTGDKAKIKLSDLIKRKEHRAVNVYVIEDPTTPENNGTVKILRYGKQLNDVITDAIEGDDEEQVGWRAFALSDEGCTFRIKVEKNSDKSDWPNYTKSKFLAPGEIEGMTEEKIAEAYESMHQLDTVGGASKTEDELRDLMNEHAFEITTPSGENETETEEGSDDLGVDSSAIDQAVSEATGAEESEAESDKGDSSGTEGSVDADIDELLEDL